MEQAIAAGYNPATATTAPGTASPYSTQSVAAPASGNSQPSGGMINPYVPGTGMAYTPGVNGSYTYLPQTQTGPTPLGAEYASPQNNSRAAEIALLAQNAQNFSNGTQPGYGGSMPGGSQQGGLTGYDAIMQGLAPGLEAQRRAGYGTAYNVTPNSAYQNPYQLNSINQQAGMMAGMENNRYTNDTNYNIAAGNAGTQERMNNVNNQTERYGIDAQGRMVDMQTGRVLEGVKDTNASNLAGIRDTNQTNLGVAGINSSTQLGLGGMNLQGQLAGYDSAQNIAGTTTAPDLLRAQTQAGMVNSLLGSGGNASTLLGSVGLSGGSGGGTILNAGSGGTSGAPTAGGSGIPGFTGLNDIMAQQKLGKTQGDINQQYDTLNSRLSQNLAGRGFSNAGAGAESLLANNEMARIGALSDAQREMDMGQMEFNARNALPYAQLGSQNQNAALDRQLRLQLAQLAGQQGMLSGLLSI